MSQVTQYGEYLVIRKIGQGTFGVVFEVKKKLSENNATYALKRIDLRKCDKKDREHAAGEVQWLQKCRHENLVGYIGSFEKDSNLCIVMEYCKKGTLVKYIAEQKSIDETECVRILLQICNGLSYLHYQDIAHRDVKTANIFLTESNEIKIGDLGLTRLMNNPAVYAVLTKTVGTPLYMSPEMINGLPYTKATDIWSLGCVLYEIATKVKLFNSENMPVLKEAIMSKKSSSSDIPYSSEMNELLGHMLEQDFQKRPNIDKIIAFLKSHQSKLEPPKSTQPKVEQPERPNFSSICPKNLKSTYIQDILVDSSGYDSSERPGSDKKPDVAYIPVYVTEDEKDLLKDSKRLENEINEKINWNTDIFDKIIAGINETKHMEDYKSFMNKMAILLAPEMFKKCEYKLKCLWIVKSELLKKNFKMAW